jgi:phytoene dehydrogenase-like protein
MGGGKALVNAYFRSAERLGVKIRYDAQVTDIEIKDGTFVAAHLAERDVDGQRLPPNVSKHVPASWPPAVLNPIANGCEKPGARTSAANGLRITF